MLLVDRNCIYDGDDHTSDDKLGYSAGKQGPNEPFSSQIQFSLSRSVVLKLWQQEQRRRSGVLRRHRVQRHERVLRLLLQRRQSLIKPKYLK